MRRNAWDHSLLAPDLSGQHEAPVVEVLRVREAETLKTIHTFILEQVPDHACVEVVLRPKVINKGFATSIIQRVHERRYLNTEVLERLVATRVLLWPLL